MKKALSKTSLSKNHATGQDEFTITISEERYRAQKQRGLTDEETMKPGTYRAVRGGFLKRHPELLATQRTPKIRVTMFLDQDVIEAFKRAAAVENALPYQTQINLALRKYLEGQTLSLSLSDTATIQTLARAIAEEMQNAKPKRK